MTADVSCRFCEGTGMAHYGPCDSCYADSRRLASPPADQPAKETCFGLSGIALMGGLEDQPADHIGAERTAIERIDTAIRLMRDGRTEMGAISDVWSSTMQRRDRLCADLQTALSLIARQEETIRGHEEALRPFARYLDVLETMGGNTPRTGTYCGVTGRGMGEAEITIEDMQEARARLSAHQPKEPK